MKIFGHSSDRLLILALLSHLGLMGSDTNTTTKTASKSSPTVDIKSDNPKTTTIGSQAATTGKSASASLVTPSTKTPVVPPSVVLPANPSVPSATPPTVPPPSTPPSAPSPSVPPKAPPAPITSISGSSGLSGSSTTSTPSAASNVNKPKSTLISSSSSGNGMFNSGNGQVTKNININYAHADPEFKQKIQSAWQNIAGSNPQAYLNIDQATASVYVRGDSQHVIDLENYIDSLDKPITQVRIDAIILYASRNYTFDLGVNWSGIYNRAQSILTSGNPFGFAGMGGSLTDIPRPTGAVGTSSIISSASTSTASYTQTGNLFVDPTNFALNLFNKVYSATTSTNAGNSFVQVPFVFGGSDLNLRRLSLVLNAAESEEKVKIVSRPSVLTSSGQEAKVIIGQQLPLQQSQLNNTGGSLYKGNSINYRSVGINLTVTPTVGADNKSVTLDISITDLEVSSGTTESNADGIMTNPPVLSDLTVSNKVSLRSGQTTVIGGLAQRKDNKVRNRIPLLHRLPIVGNLFKANMNSDSELEQFIFITPTIIEEDLST